MDLGRFDEAIGFFKLQHDALRASQRYNSLLAKRIELEKSYVLAAATADFNLDLREKEIELLHGQQALQALQPERGRFNQSGLLPIGAVRKKIRNEEGYWSEVEAYIDAHSEAQFSHGFCNDCLRERFGECEPDSDLQATSS